MRSTLSPQIAVSHDGARSWRRALFAFAVLATCGHIMGMHQADPDLWGHVQYGRELLRDGVLPRTTTWSFAAEGYPWVNHEILAEVALAWTLDHFGPAGLLLGKYLISLMIVGLVYWSGRRAGAAPMTMGLLCIVMALAMEFHWHLRPQVFGYLCFAVMLWILGAAFRGWPGTVTAGTFPLSLLQLLWLWPMMVFWANTHGSFPAGVCVALAALGLRALELIVTGFTRSGRQRLSMAGLRALGWICLIAAGTIGGTLLTPYGTELYVWLWDALHIPCAEIEDWEQLPLFTLSREALCCWIILLTTCAAVVRDKNRDWTAIVIFLLVAWQALAHVRHLPMLALVWASWFAWPIEQLRREWADTVLARSNASGTPAIPSRDRSPLTVALLSLWIAIMGVFTWPQLVHLEVPKSEYPVAAFEFLAAHRLEGRTLVTFNWAQYAIGVFADQGLNSTVAFDGRFRTCYSQEILDRYFDFLFGPDYQGPRYRSPRSGPIDPGPALTRDNPELVLISRLQRPSVRAMQQHQSDWALLYQDGLSQIWGRRDLFDQPDSPRYLPDQDRRISDVLPQGLAEYPAFPRPPSPSPHSHVTFRADR